MKIINATPKDKEELLSLYHAMIGGPCEWSENYPDENTIAFDLKNEDLFVMKNDKEEIVATISIDHDDAVRRLRAGEQIWLHRENFQGCASERICRARGLRKP